MALFLARLIASENSFIYGPYAYQYVIRPQAPGALNTAFSSLSSTTFKNELGRDVVLDEDGDSD